ncbi:MAG: pyridoxal phosphate-dependent aminotransferase family protein [bacterium]
MATNLTEGLMKSRYADFDEGARSAEIFDKAYRFGLLGEIRNAGLYPYYKTIQRNDGAVALIDGKQTLMFGSNNYLGLTAHPEVRKAAADAALEYGTSMTGSRLLNGSTPLHEALEEDLASFVGKPDALVFATGYQSNVGAISALVGKGSCAVVDRLSHASIHDALRVAKGESKKFNHNDMGDLERALQELPRETGKIIVVDGVFSMEGDVARLPEIVALARRHDTRIYVDDAHGIGVLGNGGRGTADHFGLADQVDLIMGTFSKSLASIGGFVAGQKSIVDYIRHFGRAILFSASLAPPNVAAARKALEIIRREPERVQRVLKNGRRLRDGLRQCGFEVGRSETAVVPVVTGAELPTLLMWRDLLDAGVFVNPVLYPAVPRDKALLRTSTLATHTEEQIDLAIERMERVGKNLGVIA